MTLRSVIVIVLVGMVGLNGCLVSKKKYEAAVADKTLAKNELEKSEMLRNTLEKEIRKLKGQNEKVSADLEMMGSEVKRIKEDRENERLLLESRQADLEKEAQAASLRAAKFQREFQKVKSQNNALKSTVVRYQKELKEARKRRAVDATRVPPPATTPPEPKPIMNTLPSPGQSVSQQAAASLDPLQRGAPAPVNINTASANDMVLLLGLTKEMAEKVVDNRPYRLRGELVAKQVIPKARFDAIKDRITASQ